MTLEWSQDLDAQLRDNTRQYTIASSARNMQLPVTIVRSRIRKLDIVAASVLEEKTPSAREWVATVSKYASEFNVDIGLVLSGGRRRLAVLCRMMAWNELLENPKYSIAGVARVSGFDHTTILHGRKGFERVLEKESFDYILLHEERRRAEAKLASQKRKRNRA